MEPSSPDQDAPSPSQDGAPRRSLVNRLRFDRRSVRVVFSGAWLVLTFIVAVLVMTLPRLDVTSSCLDDAAKREAEIQYRRGTLTEAQYVAAIKCDLNADKTEGLTPGGEAVAAARRIFGKTTQNILIGLLNESSRSSSAKMLASDPKLVSVSDLKSVGLLLFGIDTEGSIQAYERALTIAPYDMETLNRLGQLYYRIDKFKPAEAAFNKIIAEDGDSSKWRASALLNIGNVYWYELDRSKARNSYNLAVATCDKLGRRLCVARAMANIAGLDMEEFEKTKNKTKLIEAHNFLNKSLLLFQASRQKLDIANNEQQFAEIDKMSGDLKSAQSHAESALKMYLQVGNAEGVVMDRETLGDIYVLRGDLTAAEASFRSEQAEAEHQKMPNEIAWSWAGLATVAVARGKSTVACALFKEGFSVWSAAGLKTEEFEAADQAAAKAGCAHP